MMSTAATTYTQQVSSVYSKATPEAIWQALTAPASSECCGYADLVDCDLRSGGAFAVHRNACMKAMGGMPGVIVDGEILEATPPAHLVQS